MQGYQQIASKAFVSIRLAFPEPSGRVPEFARKFADKCTEMGTGEKEAQD
jgi:hypothetical protein